MQKKKNIFTFSGKEVILTFCDELIRFWVIYIKHYKAELVDRGNEQKCTAYLDYVLRQILSISILPRSGFISTSKIMQSLTFFQGLRYEKSLHNINRRKYKWYLNYYSNCYFDIFWPFFHAHIEIFNIDT